MPKKFYKEYEEAKTGLLYKDWLADELFKARKRFV